jgi:hypothetical protein
MSIKVMKNGNIMLEIGPKKYTGCKRSVKDRKSEIPLCIDDLGVSWHVKLKWTIPFVVPQRV